MNKKLILVVFACFIFGALSVSAQGTTAFLFQGELHLNGAPAHGSFDMRFFLYDVDDPGAGLPLCNIDLISAVNVEIGRFDVELDFGCSDIFNGQPLWLEIHVRPAGPGPFTPLFPLHRLYPVPYATFAAQANTLDGLDSTDFIQTETDPNVPAAVRNSCQVCIGWADSDASEPQQQRCHSLSVTSRDDANFLDFAGDVDNNDRLWLWFECP